MPEENSQYEKLMQYALRLIAAKRYTCLELKRKLVKYVERAGVWVGGGVGDNGVGDNGVGDNGVGGNGVGDGADGLVSGEAGDGIIEKVITRLKELQYLDDKKYIENYVADRIEFKPRGKFLIKMELKLKGINEKAIEECLRDLTPDEEEVALSTLRRRERLWKSYPVQKQKEKAFRFLASKGFEPDAIYKAVKRCYHRDIE